MKMHVRLTLIEDALGMMPGDEDILKTYLASKAPTPEKTAEEVAWCTQTEEEKRITVFPRTDNGRPMFWDYQIKGMLKDSCSALARQGKHGSPEGTACAKIKAYKKVIDGDIFVFPRRIPIDLHGLKMDTCTRPLRADTPQGPAPASPKARPCPRAAPWTSPSSWPTPNCAAWWWSASTMAACAASASGGIRPKAAICGKNLTMTAM